MIVSLAWLLIGIALEAGVNGFLATILYQPKASSGSLSGT